MNFRDVPNLLKFEQHARRNDTCEITMDAYRKVREIIRDAPAPVESVDPAQQLPVDQLKLSCAAIEKSTRILWACAAATDHVNPPFGTTRRLSVRTQLFYGARGS